MAIDIVINSHEYFDHIEANRFAATKIVVENKYVTMYKSADLNEPSAYPP